MENSCIESISRILSYNSCIDLHKNDDDFYNGEWRVYFGRDKELWKNDILTNVVSFIVSSSDEDYLNNKNFGLGK